MFYRTFFFDLVRFTAQKQSALKVCYMVKAKVTFFILGSSWIIETPRMIDLKKDYSHNRTHYLSLFILQFVPFNGLSSPYLLLGSICEYCQANLFPTEWEGTRSIHFDCLSIYFIFFLLFNSPT